MIQTKGMGLKMKKILIILVLIILVSVGIIAVKVYKEQENKNDLKNDNNIQNENIEEKRYKSNFEIIEVEKQDFEANYTIVKEMDIITKKWLILEKEDKELAIKIINSKENEMLFEKGKGVNYNEKYNIENIEANQVKTIFYGAEGQEIGYPLVILLKKDGTVKGVDIENGYKTGEFLAYDILELKDVIKIEQADVTRANDSGYQAVIASTKDGKVYEIRVKNV